MSNGVYVGIQLAEGDRTVAGFPLGPDSAAWNMDRGPVWVFDRHSREVSRNIQGRVEHAVRW
jgi:hypothetical protein